jgi:copper chaperone
MKNETMRVEGMNCAHCKAAVERELGKLPGTAANADIERGTVEVSYDEGAVTTEQLAAAIERAGYKVAA